MIIAFALGIFRQSWWWVFAAIAAGLAFTIVRQQSNAEWRAQIGVAPYDLSAFALDVIITIVLCFGAYFAGRGIRALWQFLTSSDEEKEKRPAQE